MRGTLLLDASYEPLHIVKPSRIIGLLEKGRAAALDPSPVDFASPRGIINIPYVALLTEPAQRGKGARTRGRGYSRRGVLVRDDFTCQFCGKYGDTIDHLVPQSKGGKDSYENCVAACVSCNGKKGNKSMKELGWKLARQPFAPSQYEHLLLPVNRDSEVYPIWSQYISYWAPKRELASV